ncbi:MAG: hypothetical protein ACTH2Y_14105 [Corynebacterium sp.]|uniref:hypothetical protein n=1 Tax=unclassified Corynebacterium TaxID=2624378 RepID=UPI002648517D|nr:hypothetical protein [Corynebacterium sp.]MDN5719323.1 hypothetical protein [Corynebacterium sp.]MDN6258208.1 hypothetical protein [Corynebacterium sp.]MDN6323823.1 hypothetical protein [Corynebacterium sp.]MDN6387117.1 hypothetical protein [Corynebacterium sp.]MDN6509167.1 hypothetical protein [Corynebacterium sp.]
MTSTELLVTMGSVFIGFLLFGGSFASFMAKRRPAVVWGLFGAAIVFITLIPVLIAVFWATAGPA